MEMGEKKIRWLRDARRPPEREPYSKERFEEKIDRPQGTRRHAVYYYYRRRRFIT